MKGIKEVMRGRTSAKPRQRKTRQGKESQDKTRQVTCCICSVDNAGSGPVAFTGFSPCIFFSSVINASVVRERIQSDNSVTMARLTALRWPSG